MALYNDYLNVTEGVDFELDKIYKVDAFNVFESVGKYGKHWVAVVKSGDVVSYLPQTGANALAANLEEATEEVAKGALHFSLRKAHSKKFNKDFVACDFVNK